MREIKFQGKRIDNGKWVYGSLVTNFRDKTTIYSEGAEGFSIHEVIPESVGQFTGLKDKNGIEIYNNDLLEIDGGNRIVKVIWNKNRASYDTIPIKFNDMDKIFVPLKNAHWYFRAEVIDNVFENPELLEEK